MEKKSPTWVFPTVKVLVTLFYYFVLTVLIVFALASSIKLINAQTENFSKGEAPSNYVSVPVSWGPASDKMLPSSQAPRVFLKPQKQTGLLEVPIRSTPGLLIVALGLVGLGAAAWMFLLLRRIFRTVQTDSPFHPDNARRITRMGLLFLGQALVELVLKLLLWSETRTYFRQMSFDYKAYLNVDVTINSLNLDINTEGSWLLGLILLALAQVYRRGIELQVENELTV